MSTEDRNAPWPTFGAAAVSEAASDGPAQIEAERHTPTAIPCIAARIVRFIVQFSILNVFHLA